MLVREQLGPQRLGNRAMMERIPNGSVADSAGRQTGRATDKICKICHIITNMHNMHNMVEHASIHAIAYADEK